MDQSLSEWPVTAANDHPVVSVERPAFGIALAALRTTGLLVLAALAVLVLLPAMIAAQPAFLG